MTGEGNKDIPKRIGRGEFIGGTVGLVLLSLVGGAGYMAVRQEVGEARGLRDAKLIDSTTSQEELSHLEKKAVRVTGVANLEHRATSSRFNSIDIGQTTFSKHTTTTDRYSFGPKGETGTLNFIITREDIGDSPAFSYDGKNVEVIGFVDKFKAKEETDAERDTFYITASKIKVISS